jgi:virulence-associated protein VagC
MEAAVSAHQKAKLFTHGGSQAVRLPKAFRFEGADVTIERVEDGVMLRANPAPRSGANFWSEIDRLRGEEQLAYSSQTIIEHVPGFA